MAVVALSELLGTSVYSPTGSRCGRVREVAITPQDDRARVATLVVKTREGNRLVNASSIIAADAHGLHTSLRQTDWIPPTGNEGFLLLERDLLDQQIIDVHGRKVVRVNDADILLEPVNGHLLLKVAAVDVGTRGIVRRLLKGILPSEALRGLASKFPSKTIPWEFVDLIETDPARRVKLKISHDRLAKLHPADIADIIEELAPKEREAVFETLDEEIAAGALEEVQPRFKKSILESLDSERAADIVEEMNPDAAADLLADLPEERTSEILQEMEPEERNEVAELMEFGGTTAAGRMNTEYLALDDSATVNDAIEALRNFEGGVESVSTLYLVDKEGHLAGAVPLAKLVLAKSDDQ